MADEKIGVVIWAKDEFSKSFGTYKSQAKALKKGAVALGAAVAGVGAAMFASVKSTAAAYDAIGKFSQRIGVSTEALSSYGYAAELSGVRQEALNVAWQRQARRVAEAAQGTGEASDALKELNLSATAMNKLAPDEQFAEIAKAMDGVANQGDRVRLAMRLWDTEGVALVQMMANGSEGLREMTQEAEKFGLVISGTAAANSAEFQDSMTRLGGAFRGVKNRISEELMPAFTDTFNFMAELVADNRDKIVDWARTGIEHFAKFVEYGAYGVGLLVDAFRGLQMIWEVGKIAFAEFSMVVNKGLVWVADGWAQFLKTVNIGGKFDSAITNIEAFSATSRDGIVAMETLSRKSTENLKRIADQGLAVTKVEGFVQKVKDGIASMSKAGKDAADSAVENIEQGKTENLKVIEEIGAAYTEFFASEQEKLDTWYQDRLAQITTGSEAEIQLTELYLQRKSDIEEQNRKTLAQKDQQAYRKRMQAASLFYSNLNAVGKAFGKTAFKAFKALSLGTALVETYSSASKAFNAMAGIPYIGPVLGAAAAAAAIAGGIERVNEIRAMEMPVAHTGLSEVPREEPYLLDKGERVVSRDQNEDLKAFLEAQSEAPQVAPITSIHILENATNADALLGITDVEWEDIFESRILPAQRRLTARGVTA